MSNVKKSKISIKDIGGYHPDVTLRKWPSGSIFEVEGKRLYEIVRELKPEIVVELGGYFGCSTSWIAKALRSNKKGKVISIDNNFLKGKWSMIPDILKEHIEQVEDDMFTCEVPENIDIVFDDGPKDVGNKTRLAKRFKAKKAYIVHDYCHKIVGKIVKPEFDAYFGEPDEVFIEKPSDCGLAIKYYL